MLFIGLTLITITGISRVPFIRGYFVHHEYLFSGRIDVWIVIHHKKRTSASCTSIEAACDVCVEVELYRR